MFSSSVESAREKKAPLPKAPKHPLTSIPPRAGKVESAFHFPDFPGGRKLPIGPEITVLCHLKNDGKLPINITAIMGSLNSNNPFYDYLQNFTYSPFGVVIRPAEEITLAYKFKMSKELEPEKYQLAHTVFYDREDRKFAHTFFNKTVSTYYAGAGEWDIDAIMTVAALLVGTFLFIAVFVLAIFPESSFTVSILGKPTETAVDPVGPAGAAGSEKKGPEKKGAADDDDDWVKIRDTAGAKQKKSKK